MLLVQQLAESLSSYYSTMVARRIDGVVRRKIREIALRPSGVSHLEEERFQSYATRASDQGFTFRVRSAGTAVVGQFLLIFRMCGAIASTGVLAMWFPILASLLLAASLLVRSIIRRHLLHLAHVGDSGALQQRHAEYWADLATGKASAKEIRLFGLAEWVLQRRRVLHASWVRANMSARRSVMRRQGTTLMLVAASALGAMLVPGLAAASGNLTPGELAASLTAAWGVFQIGSMGFEAFDIEYGIGAVRAMDRLESDYGRVEKETLDSRSARTVGGSHPPLVRFEAVSFAYPGSDRLVLKELSLDIRPREVLAVVGVNGAGKSTLMRLLAGMHEPSAGRITVDGIALRDLDIHLWRRRLAAVMQNFVRYPATVRENIALSVPEQEQNTEEVMAALSISGLSDQITKLPSGADTLLWSGGVDLSGGQWQMLAVARALYASIHGRRIVVLDEPTAHLDVRAEADFYERVVKAVPDVTVVLVSHRLSTVRHADRIAVLRDGRIRECGTHEELLVLDGDYARLFRLQAARFTDEPTSPAGR
ncbi:ABC transporter ATP-binding protein [Streptomyces albidoflavus]